MQGGFQFHAGEFCKRCTKGIGILECDRCHDRVCFQCRRFCWKCCHNPPKNQIRVKRNSNCKQQEPAPKKQQVSNLVLDSLSFLRKRNEKVFNKLADRLNQKKNLPPVKQSQIDTDLNAMQKEEEYRQEASYVCTQCADHCDECRVDYCQRCKVCLCNINDLDMNDFGPIGGYDYHSEHFNQLQEHKQAFAH